MPGAWPDTFILHASSFSSRTQARSRPRNPPTDKPAVQSRTVGRTNRGTFLVLAVFLAVIAAVFLRSGGPPPKPANAPSDQFSAVRAAAALRDVFSGSNTPHPLGSAAHDAVRERLAARLRALRYDVVYHRTFACDAYATCAPVTNLIAPAPGQTALDSLIIASHFDSVPAGPGASDDGLGVATTLE